MTTQGVGYDDLREHPVPRWSVLSRFGKSPVLRSSYIWFFFVPIVAKATEWTVPFRGSQYRLNWSLPFTWEVFYFSAVAFALASAIYDFFCPALIQDYPTYALFREHGKGDKQLVDYALPTIAGTSTRTLSDWQVTQLRSFLEYSENTREIWALVPDERDTMSLTRALSRIRIDEDDLSDAFWYLQSVADSNRPKLRFVCSLFYFIGFALTFVLTIENIISVLKAAY
jgi:hypothetical protein